MVPVEIENARLKLALPIPTGAPITVVNEWCNRNATGCYR